MNWPSPQVTAPRWLLWLVAILAAIAGIAVSLTQIENFACRIGIAFMCPERFSLSLGSWEFDVAGGWIAEIANPTEYFAQIVDANLAIGGENDPSVLLSVIAGPVDWHSPPNCTSPEPSIAAVELKPKATTSLRLMLYAGEQRATNEHYMSSAVANIPNWASLPCSLVVDVSSGDGHKHKLISNFQCSRLPYPACRNTK